MLINWLLIKKRKGRVERELSWFLSAKNLGFLREFGIPKLRSDVNFKLLGFFPLVVVHCTKNEVLH